MSFQKEKGENFTFRRFFGIKSMAKKGIEDKNP